MRLASIFRAMVQIFTPVQSTMKVNGMRTSEVDGGACTTVMVLFTRESGLMI